MLRAAPPTRVAVGPDARVGGTCLCGLCGAPFVQGAVEVELGCRHGVHEACLRAVKSRFFHCTVCRQLHPRLDDASLTPALDAMIDALS